ncbi:Acetate kinase [compost metagenome]
MREVGALAGVLGGVDALVFTGGIGEHAAPVREQACRALAWLGLDFDAEANATRATLISRPGSRLAALVLPTNEEWIIARHTAQVTEALAPC